MSHPLKEAWKYFILAVWRASYSLVEILSNCHVHCRKDGQTERNMRGEVPSDLRPSGRSWRGSWARPLIFERNAVKEKLLDLPWIRYSWAHITAAVATSTVSVQEKFCHRWGWCLPVPVSYRGATSDRQLLGLKIVLPLCKCAAAGRFPGLQWVPAPPTYEQHWT